MKKIEDYFGTKTAIKCENEQQWERLKEWCGDRLRYNYKFNYIGGVYFMLDENKIGNSFSERYGAISEYQILPFSDFVSDVPELVGVEMEVSDDGKEWYSRTVYGHLELGFITQNFLFNNVCAWKFARPIQPKKVITATLEELAEMLNVDEILLK
jgi:hypothetical protein